MNWTKEMLDAVKGNETPHGMLKAKCSPVWTWIEQAEKEGAGIEYWTRKGEWLITSGPVWFEDATYRVCQSWQPPQPKTLAEDQRGKLCAVSRCPFRLAGGGVPEKKGEVERCEVEADPAIGGFLVFKRIGYSFPMHPSAAQSDPDFIAYLYADGHKRPYPRVMQGNDKPALAPVAVLFRRRT